MNQFIKLIDGEPTGTPQSFENDIPPSSDWKYYRPTQEEYDPNYSLLVDKYIEDLGIVAQLVIPYPQNLIDHIELTELRETRNDMLSSSDWTQLSDTNLSDDQKDEWKSYRQSLRDITDTYKNITEVVWPISPNEKENNGE
jgi:hypothetical protein